MAHILDECALLLEAGQIGKASRLAAVRAYMGEIENTGSEEDSVKAALLSALSGDYRQAAALRRPFEPTSVGPNAYRDGVNALLLAREGQMQEARYLASAAFDNFVSSRRFALAVALSRSIAWFDYLCGDFDACRTALDRALAICAQADLPDWYRIIGLLAARLAMARGETSNAVRRLRTCVKYCALQRSDAINAAVTIALGVAVADRALLKPYADLLNVEAAFRSGQYHEAYAMVAGLVAAWRSELVEFDLQALMSLALRCLADPLEAVEVLLDVAAYGKMEDALEAAALLESAVRSNQQLLADACVNLGNVYANLHRHRYDRAALFAAQAAKGFKAIGAEELLGRAMDVLVRSSNTQCNAADRFRRLTDRQRQVLALLRAGHANKQIARTLGIGEHTVERHVSVILEELNVRSRWQLVD